MKHRSRTTIISLLCIGGLSLAVQAEPSTQPAEKLGKRTIELPAVTATVLFVAYESNEVKAQADWGNTWAVWTGKVERIGIDLMKRPYVAFKIDGDNLGNVMAYFSDPNETEKVKTLVKGQGVSIMGRVDGRGVINVSVDNCKVISFSELAPGTFQKIEVDD